MSPRKSNKAFSGKITTPPPSWLSETEANLKSADSSLVKLSDIHRPSEQPRRYFDPQALQELVASIEIHGILQPLLVRPLSQGGYELVAGERRYRAATEAGLSEVPVVVKELDDESAWAISLIENLQREDLNPLEETEGILQLLAIKFKSDLEEVPRTLYRLQKGLKHRDNERAGEPIIDLKNAHLESSHNVMGNNESPQSNIASSELAMVEEVFNSLGLMNWSSFVKNRLPLLNLPEDLKLALRSGHIAYTKAKAIASLEDEESRTALLAEAIDQRLSLSQIKERIKSLGSASPDQPQEIPDRLKAVYQQVKKNRIWSDKKKRKQLETLLNKLEALIGQTKT
jgi:ParB family transcriptional regulator, chromosome partitioning protein